MIGSSLSGCNVKQIITWEKTTTNQVIHSAETRVKPGTAKTVPALYRVRKIPTKAPRYGHFRASLSAGQDCLISSAEKKRDGILTT